MIGDRQASLIPINQRVLGPKQSIYLAVTLDKSLCCGQAEVIFRRFTKGFVTKIQNWLKIPRYMNKADKISVTYDAATLQ